MMTLDELLGNQTQTATSERFPSYEEFAQSRNKLPVSMSGDLREMDAYTQIGRNQMSALPLQREEYTEDIVRPSTRGQSFYEYVARQNKETSDADLYARLARSNDSLRPVFDRENEAGMTAAFQNTKADQKTRGRLNVKGKLILGTFLALVVTTVSLIIAYAGKINNGTAVTPASNEGAVAVSTQTVNL